MIEPNAAKPPRAGVLVAEPDLELRHTIADDLRGVGFVTLETRSRRGPRAPVHVVPPPMAKR